MTVRSVQASRGTWHARVHHSPRICHRSGAYLVRPALHPSSKCLHKHVSDITLSPPALHAPLRSHQPHETASPRVTRCAGGASTWAPPASPYRLPPSSRPLLTTLFLSTGTCKYSKQLLVFVSRHPLRCRPLQCAASHDLVVAHQVLACPSSSEIYPSPSPASAASTRLPQSANLQRRPLLWQVTFPSAHGARDGA